MSINTLDESVGVTASTPPSPAPVSGRKNQLFWLAAVLIVVLGAFLRIFPASAYSHSQAYVNGGFDESLYRDYVALTEKFGGISHYPSVCAYYLKVQAEPDATT